LLYVACRGLAADQGAEVPTDNLGRRLAKEDGTSGVDASDIPIHVTRVDNVGRLLHDLPVMFFDSVSFGESGDLNQKFFITKWNRQVIIGTSSQAFHGIVRLVALPADQEHGNRRGVLIGFKVSAEFDTI
jgi:hypothetical protein